MRKSSLLFALVVTLLSPAAHAVIVAGLDGTQNTSAPADDPGWANVGSSGVYLGNFNGGYWVITATHVGATSSISFSTGTYSSVPGSAVTVRNGDNSTTDLLLYRISSDPGLPSLTLASSAPVPGSQVVTIGNGVNRGTNQLYWSVNDNGNPSGDSSGAAWSWTSLPDSTGANASGYAWGGGTTKRYGTNNLDATTTYNIGTGVTTAFSAAFNVNVGFSPINGESQGATGDSGGAVFYKNGATWELVGIMGAIGTFNNQPGSTSVFGNETLYASIPHYNSAIVSAIPEPADVAVWCGAVIGVITFWWRRRHQCA